MIIDAISGVGGGGGTKIVQKPTVSVGTYTYDGTAQGPTITGLDTQNTIVTNATATNAGTYTLTIALKNTAKMVWNDMTTADLVYTYTISKETLTVPTVTDTTKTYNGSAQSPTITGFDSAAMTKTGDSATDAGNYTITFGLVDSTNYEWNTTNTVNWTIAKADQTITLSSNSVTLDSEHLTADVTVSGAQGAISVTSSASSVATASVSGSTITISNVNETTGAATITVSVAGTTNYNPATDSTISVSAQFADFLTDWLTAANLNPASYADLDAVLADESAVRKLFTIHDAVDVIVDEVSTISSTDLTKIFNDNYVAKWVNLRDYALDTLYANNTIAGYMDTADKYFYGEWIITDSTTTPVTWGPKGNVPIMTSNTAPYGEAFASSVASSSGTQGPAWRCFDGRGSVIEDAWLSASNATNNYVGYTFTNPVRCKKAHIRAGANGTKINTPFTYTIKASNDGTTWVTVSENVSKTYTVSGQIYDFDIDITTNDYYLRYRVDIPEVMHVSGSGGSGITSLQFYGREMKVSVPTMTSNTAPYGEVVKSGVYGAQYDGYKAFNKANTTTDDKWIGAYGQTTNQYIGYKFTQPTCVKRMVLTTENQGNGVPATYKLQGSNDGTTWVDVTSTITNSVSTGDTNITNDVVNSNAYLYYRVYIMTIISGGWISLGELQFYGFDYSEYDWDTEHPRHYIYDHGLELETVGFSKRYNHQYYGYINNESSELIIGLNYESGNNTYAGANTQSSPYDLTPYTLQRVVLGKYYNYPGMAIQVFRGGKDYDPSSSSSQVITNKALTSDHYGNALDISSVNESANPILFGGGNAENKVSYTEWWLE